MRFNSTRKNKRNIFLIGLTRNDNEQRSPYFSEKSERAPITRTKKSKEEIMIRNPGRNTARKMFSLERNNVLETSSS